LTARKSRHTVSGTPWGSLLTLHTIAEWESLELALATTRAFKDFAFAMQGSEDVSEALMRLYRAPRDAQLIAYCSDFSEASRLSSRLSEELKLTR
jgi:hypothetical protein